MNAKYKRVRTRFAPEIRFEVTPVPPAPFRAMQSTELERLKERLLHKRLEEAWGAQQISGLRRAANEAVALAWLTPYPLLVFPALFDEKAETALLQAEHQNQVRERSRELLLA